MLKRAIRILQKAEGPGYERVFGAENPNIGYDYMTLSQACSIFGYQLNDSIEKKELRKRFNKLALKHHPDHGGTKQDFHALLEAHKLLQSVRHDKGGQEGRYQFKQARHPRDDYKATTEPTRDEPFGKETDDDKKFDKIDVFGFFIMFSFCIAVVMKQMRRVQERVMLSKTNLTEEEMVDPATLMSHRRDWHPWKASMEDREQVKFIAPFQSQVRKEAALAKEREKKQKKGKEDNENEEEGELAPSPLSYLHRASRAGLGGGFAKWKDKMG